VASVPVLDVAGSAAWAALRDGSAGGRDDHQASWDSAS
jgi:hypothetical protein